MATVVPLMAIMAHIPQMKVRRLPDYVSLYLIAMFPLAIRAEGFLEQIRFFTRLILNADETNLLE